MDIEAPVASPNTAVKPHSFYTNLPFKPLFLYKLYPLLCYLVEPWAVDSVMRGRSKNDKYFFVSLLQMKAQESANLY